MTGHTIVNGKKVKVKQIVQEIMADFEPILKTDELDEVLEALREAVDLQDAWAAINPHDEQQRIDDMIDQVRLEESDDNFSEIQIPNFSNKIDLKTCQDVQLKHVIRKLHQIKHMSMMRKLNEKQRQLFNYVSKWCDDKARNLTLPPFHIFLTGGAGTGKSHVINCIKYYAQKIFSRITESADDVSVLLLAHSGTAAFNISGGTICSALKIGVNLSDYKPLSEDCLYTLRAKYQHLQTCNY